MRAVSLILAILLAACTKPPETVVLPASTPDPAIEAAMQDEPLPEAVQIVSDTVAPVAETMQALADEIVPEAPPEPPLVAAWTVPATDLIARWEIGSRARYNKLYKGLIWPGGGSGITWCIGYDGGTQSADTIGEDWVKHGRVADLRRTSGYRGKAAKVELVKYKGIFTEYDYCLEVFSERSLIEYERLARRVFGKNFDALRPFAKAALVSLVYNRGGSTVGESRREMKAIGSVCMKDMIDYACIAYQIRSMTRLWKGTTIEGGMTARREAEAILVEQE